MSEEQIGGRVIFAGGADRSMLEENEIVLASVGIDIGSSTSHLVVSRIALERRDSRYVVRARDLLFESGILLTPYLDDETIDTEALGLFFVAQYEAAGIAPDDIDSGALILTGVAAQRRNARAIGELFARETGRFVALSAGDRLETILAAYGSGAVYNSEAVGAVVMNVDIGGGTSKIAICDRGTVADVTAIDIGARLVAFDPDGTVTRVEAAGRRIADAAGIVLAPGQRLSRDAMTALAERMADRLAEAIFLEQLSPETAALLRLPAIRHRGPVDAITISGGVSEFVYGYESGSFGDLGPLLAAAVRARILAAGARLMEPVETIRATVIGASQYTVQLSGSTIFVAPPGTLPLRNVPVIAPDLPLSEETLDERAIAEATRDALRRFDLEHGETAVALCYRWSGSATFGRVDAFARGICRGLSAVLGCGHALVLVGDGDIGGVVGIHCVEELALAGPVVSIDGIELEEFDFIDIGALIPASGAVPVVVKSLVFPAGTGRERSGTRPIE